MAVQISDLYDNAIQEISKLTFMYGVKYGRNMEKSLNEITVNSQKETINSRFEYSVDYSENGYFDEAKDDKLDNLIREALKLSEDDNKKIEIDLKYLFLSLFFAKLEVLIPHMELPNWYIISFINFDIVSTISD